MNVFRDGKKIWHTTSCLTNRIWCHKLGDRHANKKYNATNI